MKKDKKPLNLLIVEDNPGDYVLLKSHLQRTRIPVKELHWAEHMEQAAAIVSRHKVDLAFLDLSLAESQGLDSFILLEKLLPQTPIIVLSGLTDMEVATETITHGAQDYLVKGEFDEKVLAKAIQYGLERKKILQTLKESNDRYEMVNRATLDIIWDWEFETDHLFLGNNVPDILGYTEQNVTMNWFFDRIHPEDRDRVKNSLSEARQNHNKHWAAEFWFLAANGNYKFVYSRGYTLYNKEEEPYRMIGAASDLTEKKILQNELVEQQLQHQKLITDITIRAQEKERNELGKELHDNINQVLATVQLFLSMAKNDETVRANMIDRSYANLKYAMEEIRKLSKSLVAPSLGDVGLEDALKELAEEINLTNGLKVTLTVQHQREQKLDDTIELMLYRIAQEQMNNVIKYAKATHASIILHTFNENIFMAIKDNGIGFDPAKKSRGIGLKNISSRVDFYSGMMNIQTAPGQGCSLEITIPTPVIS